MRRHTHRFRSLLASLLGLGAIHFLVDALLVPEVVMAPLGAAVLLTALRTMTERRWVMGVAAALAVPALGRLGLLLLEPGGDAEFDFFTPFFAFCTAVVTVEVLREEQVTEDTVLGSVCAYLLAGLAFASLYQGLETWFPGSLSLGGETPRSESGTYVYFSFVTMTTLGYGDILPVSPVVRSWVVLQSTLGVLYPSIVVARVVALYSAGGGQPFSWPDRQDRGLPGRYEVLLGILLLMILALPFTAGLPATGLVLVILFAALSLGAVYSVSANPWSFRIGACLAAASILLRVVETLRPSSGTESAALVADMALLALVSHALVVALLRAQRVTTDVLMAAICLYLILGFTVSTSFRLVEEVRPGSVGPAFVGPSDMIYFSFATLTTTGFGELAPQTGFARALALVASVLGVFYPAILLARLLSLYEKSDG